MTRSTPVAGPRARLYLLTRDACVPCKDDGLPRGEDLLAAGRSQDAIVSESG